MIYEIFYNFISIMFDCIYIGINFLFYICNIIGNIICTIITLSLFVIIIMIMSISLTLKIIYIIHLLNGFK